MRLSSRVHSGYTCEYQGYLHTRYWNVQTVHVTHTIWFNKARNQGLMIEFVCGASSLSPELSLISDKLNISRGMNLDLNAKKQNNKWNIQSKQ